jgi:peptide/nickel transport system substrate-binding protein
MYFKHFLDRKGFVMVLLALTALLLAGAVFMSSAQDEGVLRVGMVAPVVLEPEQISNDPELAFNRAIYDTLIVVSPTDSSIVGNLATEWTVSDDGLTYTLTLAEGVTFHDGSPFSSADVVFTFNRLKEMGSPALALLGEYQVSAPDAQTVVFTLPAPNNAFVYGIAAPQTAILKDGVETPNDVAEGDSPYANFNGTGPFILTEYTPGVGGHALFEKNPNYWVQDQPALNGLELVFFGDTDAQISALIGGEVDFIFKVPFNQLERLEGEDGITVIQAETAQHAVIRLRTDEGFVGSDVRVRQALKYATDRTFLNDLLLNGRGVVGHNDPIAPVHQFYNPDFQSNSYDPVKACELLAEAGIESLEGTLYAPIAFEYADLAATLQQMWGDTGCINVQIETVEEGLFYDFSNPNNYFEVELGITGWGHRPSPLILLRLAYVQSGIESGWNESRWWDPELEELVAEANSTTDNARLQEIYNRISEIFEESGPIIVPYFAPLIGATRDNVTGLTMDPFPGLTDYRTVSVG